MPLVVWKILHSVQTLTTILTREDCERSPTVKLAKNKDGFNLHSGSVRFAICANVL